MIGASTQNSTASPVVVCPVSSSDVASPLIAAPAWSAAAAVAAIAAAVGPGTFAASRPAPPGSVGSSGRCSATQSTCSGVGPGDLAAVVVGVRRCPRPSGAAPASMPAAQRREQVLLLADHPGARRTGELVLVGHGQRARRARLDAQAAEDAAQVVDLVDAAVPLPRRELGVRGVVRTLDVDRVRGARPRAQLAADALLQPVGVPVELVAAVVPRLGRHLLERVLLGDRRPEHVRERDAEPADRGEQVPRRPARLDERLVALRRRPRPRRRAARRDGLARRGRSDRLACGACAASATVHLLGDLGGRRVLGVGRGCCGRAAACAATAAAPGPAAAAPGSRRRTGRTPAARSVRLGGRRLLLRDEERDAAGPTSTTPASTKSMRAQVDAGELPDALHHRDADDPGRARPG